MGKRSKGRDAGRSILHVKGGGRGWPTMHLQDHLPGPLRIIRAGVVVRVVPPLDPLRYAPPVLRRKVLGRDRYQCRYCGVALTYESANIDHVKPWKHGGSTKAENLVASCQPCNKAKGNRAITPKSAIGRVQRSRG